MEESSKNIIRRFIYFKINIDTLILFAFFILVIYSTFETKLFFQRVDYFEVFEEESTNVYNQIIYLFLFLVVLISLIFRYDSFFNFIKEEKFLLLFILFCIISIFWSDYPNLSLKRSIQLLIKYLVIVITLLNINSTKILKTLKIIISLYVFSNLFFCIFNINSSIDPVFGSWRGIEVQKNGLGQISLYCFLITLLIYRIEQVRSKKIYDLILMFISVFLIFMARSSSVIVTFLLVVIALAISYLSNLFKLLGLKKSFIFFVLFFVLANLIIFLMLSKDIFASVPDIFGKDLTLSGRVPIWLYIWSDAKSKFLLGFGYATYWIMGSTRIDLFALNFEGFKVNEAHNGYLEIILQLGFIGFLFFLVFLCVYLYRTIKIKNDLAIIIFLFMIVINITESLWFQVRGQLTIILIAAYVSVSLEYFRLTKT